MKALPLRALPVGLILLLAGCANYSGKAPVAVEPKAATIYVIGNGWHTELALPVADISGKLTVFKRDFPDATWLAFGWGERAFFMAQHPTVGEALRAIFPAPAALLVTAFHYAPHPGDQVFAVPVSRSGLVALSNYLWKYVATSSNGSPKRLGAGKEPSSAFFASTGSYDLFHTCNTWTAAALHAAGVPVTADAVILEGQLVRQLRHLQKSETRGPAATAAPAGT